MKSKNSVLSLHKETIDDLSPELSRSIEAGLGWTDIRSFFIIPCMNDIVAPEIHMDDGTENGGGWDSLSSPSGCADCVF